MKHYYPHVLSYETIWKSIQKQDFLLKSKKSLLRNTKMDKLHVYIIHLQQFACLAFFKGGKCHVLAIACLSVTGLMDTTTADK